MYGVCASRSSEEAAPPRAITRGGRRRQWRGGRGCRGAGGGAGTSSSAPGAGQPAVTDQTNAHLTKHGQIDEKTALTARSHLPLTIYRLSVFFFVLARALLTGHPQVYSYSLLLKH